MIALSDRRTAALEHDSESLDGSGTWAAVPAPGGLRSFRGAAPPSGGARTLLFSVLSVQKQADAVDVQGEHGEGDGAPAQGRARLFFPRPHGRSPQPAC